MADIELPLGTDYATALVFRDRLGAALTSLLDSDEFSAAVWPGDDLPALFAPTVTWLDSSAARAQLAIAAADTAGLEPGVYPGSVEVLRGAQTRAGRRFTVELLAAPGLGAARPVYSTLDDLRRASPGIDLRSLAGRADQAGFREERADARDWLDQCLQRHYRGGVGVTRQQGLLMQCASRTGRSSPWLQQKLDAGALVLAGPGGRALVRAVSCYALARIFRSQRGGEKSPYPGLAAEYLDLAEWELACVTAELDTDGDGVSDLVIDLGSADRLRG